MTMAAALHAGSEAIWFVASMIIAWGIIAALPLLMRGRLAAARERAGGAVIDALNFASAATLLATLAVPSFAALGTFVVIFALRFTVKMLFRWELRRAAAPPS